MLSPHEFATLMLVKNAQGTIEMDGADPDALVERQLVSLEKLAERPAHLIGHEPR